MREYQQHMVGVSNKAECPAARPPVLTDLVMMLNAGSELADLLGDRLEKICTRLGGPMPGLKGISEKDPVPAGLIHEGMAAGRALGNWLQQLDSIIARLEANIG